MDTPAPASEQDITINVALGETFDFKSRARYRFHFDDFTLFYEGYLPSVRELYGFGTFAAGSHYFTVMPNARPLTEPPYSFTWSRGTGLLSPTSFEVGGQRYIFDPSAAKIELAV